MAEPILVSWIRGERLRSHGPASDLIENINPATGAVVSLISPASPTDVDAAVNAARHALPSWAATPRRERALLLERVAARLESRLHDFALSETRDQGKPVSLARSLDIPRAIDNLRFFAAEARTLSEESFSEEGPGGRRFTSLARREPVGVCALITPWNLPLYLLTWKLAPALVMGNTVVCKPSELTSTTACMLAEIFHDCGCPPGVLNIVLGLGSVTGQALVDHPQVRLISFTGGTATGQHIAQAAARRHTKLSLELGGKNASLVFADADPLHAARTCARAAFLNQGQICLAGSRILVHQDIYKAFVDAFCREVGALKLGDPEHESTTLGPVVSLEHRNKIERAVHGALDLGAERLAIEGQSDLRPRLDSRLSEGAFLNPSVLTGTQADWPIEQEEVFGPVATLNPFADEDEAVQRANGVRYGLSAAIFTRDVTRAHRVSHGLQCGTVWVNTWLARDLRVPFGGIKASGSGREGGRWSLDFYSETKTMVVDHSS